MAGVLAASKIAGKVCDDKRRTSAHLLLLK